MGRRLKSHKEVLRFLPRPLFPCGGDRTRVTHDGCCMPPESSRQRLRWTQQVEKCLKDSGPEPQQTCYHPGVGVANRRNTRKLERQDFGKKPIHVFAQETEEPLKPPEAMGTLLSVWTRRYYTWHNQTPDGKPASRSPGLTGGDTEASPGTPTGRLLPTPHWAKPVHRCLCSGLQSRASYSSAPCLGPGT